jgi:hypothetical protein
VWQSDPSSWFYSIAFVVAVKHEQVNWCKPSRKVEFGILLFIGLCVCTVLVLTSFCILGNSYFIKITLSFCLHYDHTEDFDSLLFTWFGLIYYSQSGSVSTWVGTCVLSRTYVQWAAQPGSSDLLCVLVNAWQRTQLHLCILGIVNRTLRVLMLFLYSLYMKLQVMSLRPVLNCTTETTLQRPTFTSRITRFLTLKNSTFCLQSAFMCCLLISVQTAIIYLCNTDWTVFIIDAARVYSAVQA